MSIWLILAPLLLACPTATANSRSNADDKSLKIPVNNGSATTTFIAERAFLSAQLGPLPIKEIIEDATGYLWAISNSQIHRLDGLHLEDYRNLLTVENMSSLPKNIKHVRCDKQNRLWISAENGLFILSNNRRELQKIIIPSINKNNAHTNRVIRTFAADKGTHWVFTETSLFLYHPESNDISRPHATKAFSRFSLTVFSVVQSNGTFYLTTNKGLFHFDPTRQTVTPVKLNVSLPPHTDLTVLANNQILFTHSKHASLYSIAENKFTPISEVKYENRLIKKINRTTIPKNIPSTEKTGKFRWFVAGNQLFGMSLKDNKIFPVNIQVNDQKILIKKITALTFLKDKLLLAAQPQGLYSIELPPINSNFKLDNTNTKNKSLKPELRVHTLQTKNTIHEILDRHSETTLTIPFSEADAVRLSITISDLTHPADWRFDFWINNDITTTTSKNRNQVNSSRSNQFQILDLKSGMQHLNIQARNLKSGSLSNTVALNLVVLEEELTTRLSGWIIWSPALLPFFWLAFTSRTRLKQALKLSKTVRKKEELLENALLDPTRGIWDCDINHDDFMCSSLTIYVYRKQPLTISLKKYLSLIHSEDSANAIAAWKNFIHGTSQSFKQTYRIFFYDEWIWNRVVGRPNSFTNNRPSRASGVWTDITMERQAQNELFLYNQAFQSTNDIVFILNKNFTIIAVNKAYEKLSGFTKDRIVDRSMEELALQRYSAEQVEQMKLELIAKGHWVGETYVPRKNGPSVPIVVRTDVIERQGEETGYVVVARESSLQDPSVNQSLTSHFYDETTSLPKKSVAFDQLRVMAENKSNRTFGFSIIIFGLNQLDDLRSKLGEESGDTILAKVAARLLPYIEKSDLFARYEDESFIILFSHSQDQSGPSVFINQLLKETSKPLLVNEQTVNLSAYAGVSNFPEDGEYWADLVTCAESAYEQTKQQGKKLIQFYNEQGRQEQTKEIRLEKRLQSIMERNELFVVFQPQIDVAKKQPIFLSVQIRWQYEKDKILYPTQFMPMATELLLSHQIIRWQLNYCLNILDRWHTEGLTVGLSIPLPIDFIAETADNLAFMQNLANSYVNLMPFIEFTLDESEIDMDDTQAITKVRKVLFPLGAKLGLANFCKKHGALQLATHAVFDGITIHSSIIREIDKTNLTSEYLKGIIDILRAKNKSITINGIETRHQFDCAVELGCDLIQGYLISDPLNENAARQYLIDVR